MSFESKHFPGRSHAEAPYLKPVDSGWDSALPSSDEPSPSTLNSSQLSGIPGDEVHLGDILSSDQYDPDPTNSMDPASGERERVAAWGARARGAEPVVEGDTVVIRGHLPDVKSFQAPQTPSASGKELLYDDIQDEPPVQQTRQAS